MNTKKNRKSNMKSRIIKRQIDEIDSLKKKIADLEIDCKEKDEIIKSIDTLRVDFKETIDDIKRKGEAYDKLIDELTEMKKVMNEEVFKGRWNLVRLLIK